MPSGEAAPHGFAAYELWQCCIRCGRRPYVQVTSSHRGTPGDGVLRLQVYLTRNRDLLFPNAAAKLEAAAVHYDHELEPLHVIHDLCNAACERDAWHADERAKAREAIGDALQADRQAVAGIGAALTILDG